MKKKYILLGSIVICVLFIFLIIGYYRKNNGYLSSRKVQVLHYQIVKKTAMPGKYKKKIIDKKSDIRKVIRMVNQAKKKKIDSKETVYGGFSTIIVLKDKNGNEIGHLYPYTGRLWIINDEWYEVTDESTYQKLREYYFALDYDEVDWDGKLY